MNCYGYAFRFLLKGTTLYSAYFGGYKQQPGDFVASNRRNEVMAYSEYATPSQAANVIENNMLLDAARAGYSITRYYPDSS